MATVGALLIDLRNYQPFLYLLGSFFVPLFGVLLADWLLAGCTTPAPTSSRARGSPGLIAAWLAGFGLYQWLSPQGPGLVDEPRRARHTRTRSPWGGASLPSFALAFALAYAPAHCSRADLTLARVIALLGNLSRDLIAGAAPHRRGAVPRGPGAAAPRAPARIFARCAAGRPRGAAASARRARDAGALHPGETTASFAISYDGDHRDDEVEALGDTWGPADVPDASDGELGARRAARAQRLPAGDARGAGPRAAALARRAGPRPRPPVPGRSSSTPTSTRDLLRHVWVLKLAEEEAECVGDLGRPRRPRASRDPRLARCDRLRGRRAPSTSRLRASTRDPTGAGDAFAPPTSRPAAGPRAGRRGAPRHRGRRGAARGRA